MNKLTDGQVRIFDCIWMHGEMTNAEIASRLSLSIKNVTNRTGELIQRKKLKIKGTKIVNGKKHKWRCKEHNIIGLFWV